MQRSIRFLFFTVWAVLMTALTYILGAPSLKVLRRRLGRANYWALTLGISAALFWLRLDTHGPGGVLDFRTLSLAFLSLSVLIGVFDEFEEMGFNVSACTAFTILINSMLAAGGFALWVYSVGATWNQILLNGIEATLKPVSELNPHLQINFFDLMLQLPSIAVIFWLVALYVSLLMENRLAVGEMAPPVALPWAPLRPQLESLRLPDACVWVFIAALLGSFLDFGARPVEAVSVNVMNVCVLLFFFQGVAVVGKFFRSIRLSAFWQILFMVLVVVQLFLVVSLLGLLDFWLDFRVRLAKRTEQFNRET